MDMMFLVDLLVHKDTLVLIVHQGIVLQIDIRVHQDPPVHHDYVNIKAHHVLTAHKED